MAEIESQLAIDYEDRLTIVRVEAKNISDRADIQLIKDDLKILVEESDIGLVLDCVQVTGKISSYLLGALVGIAKAARTADKEFAVCSLSSHLQQGYEVARLSSKIPAYEDSGSAITSIGDPGTSPTTAVRPTNQRVRQTKSRSRKARQAKTKQQKTKTVVSSSWSMEENGKAVAIAGSVVAAAILMIIVSQTVGFSSLLNIMPKSKAPVEWTLSGRIQYMNRGEPADDAGALVVVWPTGVEPSEKLTLERLEDLASSGSSDEIFVAQAEKDGSYTLPIEGSSDQSMMNILIVSNHLKDKTPNESNISTLQNVLEDPLEVVGSKGHELSFVSIDNNMSEYDATLIPRYVPK